MFLTHLCVITSTTSTLWTDPFHVEGVSGLFLLIPCFIEIPVFNAINEDPNRTLHSDASDVGLHCLPMSL